MIRRAFCLLIAAFISLSLIACSGETVCVSAATAAAAQEVLAAIAGHDDKDGTSLPDKIFIQIIDSKDPNKVIKQGEKNGLHDAFSIGLVWLERALA